MRGAGAWGSGAGLHSTPGTSPRPGRQPPQPEPPVDLGEWDAGDDDKPIAPRGWLLGNLFCREFLSSLLGDGATGKTAFRIACALSMATGRPLIGEHVFERSRVLYLSFEDGREELRRRVRAAQRHHKVSNADIKDYLFLAAFSRSDVKLAVQRRNGEVAVGKLSAAIERAIARCSVDVVILDPLVKTHGVNENDNNALDFVAEILVKLAAKREDHPGLAIDIPHHTRKGGHSDSGNGDIGRGASAIKDGGRLVYTLTKMTVEEAEKLGVSEADRRSLIRMDAAKVNIVPADKAKWFKLVGVPLDNGDEIYPKGDNVQTVECWTPVDIWKTVTAAVAHQILDRIEVGPTNGRKYSSHKSATDRAAWRVVYDVCPSLTETQCHEVISTWLDGRSDRHFLKNEPYRDPKDGDAKGLVVVGRPG